VACGDGTLEVHLEGWEHWKRGKEVGVLCLLGGFKGKVRDGQLPLLIVEREKQQKRERRKEAGGEGGGLSIKGK